MIRHLAAALACAALVALALPASAAPEAPAFFATIVDAPATGHVELVQNRRDVSPKPPQRGSSAELYGGSSADRYGGSSADRRGVAGRYDERNRGVKQYSRNRNRKDEPKPKSDEMEDQDDEGQRDRFSFVPFDPAERLNSRDRD